MVCGLIDFERGASSFCDYSDSAMAAPNVRTSSFSRNISVVSSSPQIPGLKCGPNGTTFISTGIRDLDSEFSPSSYKFYI